MKKYSIPKHKDGAWFVALRGSYLPVSWKGWLMYIPFAAYAVFAVIAGWQQTSTNTQAVLLILPNLVAATVIMTWIAKHTS